jgi:hypothetical protein
MRNALAVAVLAVLAGCSWKGSPKVPIEVGYSECVQKCPSHTCAPKGDAWECLPEAGK